MVADSQPKSSGLVLGRRPLGAVLHSSNEPGELSQWLCHDDSTINIVLDYYYIWQSAEMSVHPSVRPSVRHSLVLCQNGETHHYFIFSQISNGITWMTASNKVWWVKLCGHFVSSGVWSAVIIPHFHEIWHERDVTRVTLLLKNKYLILYFNK